MFRSRKEELDDNDELLDLEDSALADLRKERREMKRQAQAAAQKAAERSATKSEDAEEENSGKGKATRSREDAIRDRERASQSAAENIPLVGGLVTYFQGVRTEVQQVTWPTTEEAQRLTRIVLVVTIAFAIVLGLVDVFYGYLFRTAVEDTMLFLGALAAFLVIAGGASWQFIFKDSE
jgi:preprotein translocase subunit SecE